MKKIILSLVLIICIFVISAYVNADGSGTCGPDATWEYDGSGTLKISGIGYIIINSRSPDTSLYKIREEIKKVIISDGITMIPDRAFKDFHNLESIIIPKSVTTIGDYAFSGCKLTSITIPDSVTAIGEGAFENCCLSDITIPDSVTKIEKETFAFCTGLSNIKLPDTLKIIEKNAFYYCTMLESIDLPGSLVSIGEGAFYECKRLKNINIADGITCIDNNAFEKCIGLESITIPKTVTEIKYGAFENCENLKNITLCDGIKIIQGGAFERCNNLKSISIPKSVTLLTNFFRCEGLKEINVSPDNETYCSDNGVLYDKEMTKLIRCPAAKEGSYIIPDGVTSIENYAFRKCKALNEVTLPYSLTSIEYDAFEFCGIKSIDIPESVTYIGAGAFRFCNNIEKIRIDANLETILRSTFYACSKAKSIIIPESVKSIGIEALISLNSLTDIYYMGTEEKWNNIEIEGNDNKNTILKAAIHFGVDPDYNAKVSKISIDKDNGLKVITDFAFVLENTTAVCGIYNAEGMLVSVRTANIDTDTDKITFNFSDNQQDGDFYINLFIWDNNEIKSKKIYVKQ